LVAGFKHLQNFYIKVKIFKIFSGSGFPTYALINSKGEYKPGVPRPSRLSKETLSEWIKER
jgi:hypothetical protein